MKKNKILRAAAPNIIKIVIIYTIMLFFKLDFIGLLFVITGIMWIFLTLKKTKPGETIKVILKTLAFVTTLHIAFMFLGAYALAGMIAYIVVSSCLIIWRQKQMITDAVDELEIAIYGREFKTGEKRPKIKFVKKKSCDNI